MAVLSRGLTFGATETVTNTKLHNLVDDATISGIVDDDISPSADISPLKLSDIDVANKVSGLSLFALASTPSGAGRFPSWNMSLDIGASLASIPNSALIPLSMASLVHAISIRSLASISRAELFPYNVIVGSLASGGVIQYDGLSNFIGKNIQEINPSGLILRSVTTLSAVALSSDIVLEPNKLYMVRFDFIQNTSTGQLALRFNSDSTLGNYAYNGGTTNEAEIRIGATTQAGRWITGMFNIDTFKKNADSAFVFGKMMTGGQLSLGSQNGSEIFGTYLPDTTIASFEFVTLTGTLTGKVYLYEYALTV